MTGKSLSAQAREKVKQLQQEQQQQLALLDGGGDGGGGGGGGAMVVGSKPGKHARIHADWRDFQKYCLFNRDTIVLLRDHIMKLQLKMETVRE